MFLPSLFSRISSSSSSLSLFALFYLAHFDKKNHAYRKRKNRRILGKFALCHVAKDQLCFCWVYLAAYRRRRRLCLSLCSLLSGSFCVANCQRGWCEARHLPSKLTLLLTRNYMHLWAAYFTNGFYMTQSKRCINYTHQSTNLATKSWLKQFSTRKVL